MASGGRVYPVPIFFTGDDDFDDRPDLDITQGSRSSRYRRGGSRGKDRYGDRMPDAQVVGISDNSHGRGRSRGRCRGRGPGRGMGHNRQHEYDARYKADTDELSRGVFQRGRGRGIGRGDSSVRPKIYNVEDQTEPHGDINRERRNERPGRGRGRGRDRSELFPLVHVHRGINHLI